MGRDSSRVLVSTFLINPHGTQFGSKRSFLPAEDMSSPVLGQMTGGSFGEPHVDLKPMDNSEAEDALRAAAETMNQLGMQQISQRVEVSQELLIYPEGRVDPVTITETDVEGLEPGRYLGNNIVDFYVRFLERGLSPEHGNRLFFFNSFFFTKLLQSTASTGIDPCKVDYDQLRKWTKEVNLFAKDYVFIPIIKSDHWSLIIICHLSDLTPVPGEMTRPPCVVHLDPLEGQHESFEGLIRSYVIQAWMERFQVSTHGDQLLALCQMKYVKAQVRKQDNSSDCGVHVLNYIESFLVKSTLPDFSFPSSEMDSHLTGPHFVREVLVKREQIRNLIHELSGISQKRARKRRAIQEVLQSTENLRFLLFHEGDVSSAVRGINSEACLEVVRTVGRTYFNGQGSEIKHASTNEASLNPQDRQSIFISRGDNELLDGPQIGHMEYGDRNESFSRKQEYDEVQPGRATHFNGPMSSPKPASTCADAFDVPRHQSSGISSWHGLEVQHAASARVNEDNMLQHRVSDELAGNSEACMEDAQTVGPTSFNGEGSEIKHVSTHEDAHNPQDRQSTFISRGDNELLGGPQIELMEYEDRSESLSLNQEYVEPQVQTHLNGSISVAKHASTHGDALDIQHEHPRGTSRLDGLELQRGEYERVNEDNMVQHPVCEEVACMDLSEVQPGKNKRRRIMTPEETGVLLSCMVEGGPFCNGSRTRTHWNLVSDEIGKQLGSVVSADQCRLRYDTLLKAYNTYKKYCKKTGKTFSAITKAERLDLKLATTLTEDMYTTMDGIHETRTKASVSQKRMKLSSDVCNDLHPLGSPDSPGPNAPAISRGRSFENEAAVLDSACGTIGAALGNVIPASMFSSLNEDLQLSLLHLVQECSCEGRFQKGENRRDFRLESACRRLAILQDREPREIRKHVFELWKLQLVNVENMMFEGHDLALIGFWESKTWFFKSELYDKIWKEVLCKNPHWETYCTSYPIRQPPGQCIRVLSLFGCTELEHLDLREFPSLRILTLDECRELSSVTGWEVSRGLASLEISECLKFFSSNQSFLSGLRALKTLRIYWSPNLRKVPGLGSLKGLTHLDIRFSGVEDVAGVEELHLLTSLSLCWCASLEQLPFLGHLTALVHLNLMRTKVKEIPGLGSLKGLTELNLDNSGVEEIAGVEELHLLTSLSLCGCASLEWLPFLGHLTALVHLNLMRTKVMEIPGLGSLKGLTKLDLNDSAIGYVEGVEELHLLTSLSLCGCESLEWLPFLGPLTTLVHLDLRRTKVDEIPGLGSLKGLAKLDLDDSAIEDVEGVEELHLLTSLSLGWCASLKRLPFLGHLTALVYLDLRGTKVKEIPGLGSLKGFTELYLGGSAIEDVAGLEELHLLTSLSLCWCASLERLPFLGHLTALVHLNLSWTKVKVILGLGSLKGLTELNLDNSGVEDVAGVEELHLLTSLSLCGCASLEWLPFLGHLTALVHLDLSWTKVNVIPGLGSLKRLTKLDLDESKVQDVAGVEELQLLTSLSLCGCASLERLPFLGHLTALVYLDLRGTKVKEIPGREHLTKQGTTIWDF